MPKKVNPIEAHLRARNTARKLIDSQGTIRSVAKDLGVSNATVHRDLHFLEEKDPTLYGAVTDHLSKNFNEKHLRGAEAVRKKVLQSQNEIMPQPGSKPAFIFEKKFV